MSECQRRIAYLLGVITALGRTDAEGWGLAGSSFETSEKNQTPLVGSV